MVYEQENNYMVTNEFHLNGISKSKINLNLNKSADLDSIFNLISNVNFGIISYSGVAGNEKILYKMLTSPENSDYYQTVECSDNKLNKNIKIDSTPQI